MGQERAHKTRHWGQKREEMHGWQLLICLGVGGSGKRSHSGDWKVRWFVCMFVGGGWERMVMESQPVCRAVGRLRTPSTPRVVNGEMCSSGWCQPRTWGLIRAN